MLCCAALRCIVLCCGTPQGGRVIAGKVEPPSWGGPPGGARDVSGGFFVSPVAVEIGAAAECVKDELFGPLLYVLKFEVRRCNYSTV